VARASGSVAAEDLAILKDLASWLELDRERFRTMMEKVLPVEMHQVKDIETVLGITSDMSKERVRRHLNKEYSKWNSRVTNADPGIQTQADQMLKLIAETRSQYTSEQRALQEDTRVSTR
jgi:23S rRNA U2552 (ribose-2'-O)-methylase RlmE/FtsJ